MAHDVLVAGETLIDLLPDRPGSLAAVESFERRAGGAPANVAVALARLDRTPLFWTRIGADPFGDFLADRLASEGIPDRYVERDSEAKTTLAFVAHDEDADREFTFYRDRTADTRLESGVVPDDALDELRWVHVGGVTLTSEPARTATLDLAERASEHGCTVSFDPNARPELWDGGFDVAVEEVFAVADVVKATPADLAAAGIEGDGPAELADAVRERGPHTLLLTLGADGAYASADSSAPWGGDAPGASETIHPGFDAEVVDATGAGDAFTAGAIAALLDDESISESVAFADAVAAAATAAVGAMEGLPDRAAVRRIRRR